MPELGFTARRYLERHDPRVRLPARYDDLSPEQRRWARGEYARIQQGRCYHCKGQLSQPPPPHVERLVLRREYPEHFFTWRVHLHHSHASGLTIGAVHARCNAVLWEYHGE